MEPTYSSVLARVEQVLAHSRDQAEPPSPQEIDDLYTDACAVILTLEGKRSRLMKRLTDVDASVDEPSVIARSRELAGKRAEIDIELVSLRALTKGLSTAAEWQREPAAAEVAELLD